MRNLRVVRNGLGSLLVALHSENTHLGVRQDVQHRVEHSHPGAENRDDHDRVLDLHARRLRDRRDDGNLDGAKVLEALDRKELRDLVDELAELLRLCVDVAHERDAVLYQRMG